MCVAAIACLSTPVWAQADSVVPSSPGEPWLVYSGDAFSVLFVGGVLLDVTAFGQDDASRQQLGDLERAERGEVRAIRVGVVGAVNLPLPLTYALAGAYRAFDQGFDTDTSASFTVFDLTLGVPIPRVGQLTVGKMKEPFSAIRVMSLAWEPMMERSVEMDGLLPSRNVGVTVSNTAFNQRATWSVGWFNDWIESGEAFESSSSQLVGRLTGIPVLSTERNQVLHLGASGRYSDAKAGFVRFGTSPEAFFTPDFVETGMIDAEHAIWLGLEGSWTTGPVWVNSEYVGAWVSSEAAGDPFFRGFHATINWAVTGETRAYNQASGLLRRVIPRRKATEGGLGAIEVAARYSRLDLNDAMVQGGDVRRLSAGVSWYPTADARLAVNYGYVTLHRFGTVGHTSIFQARLQLLIG